jgi:transposase
MSPPPTPHEIVERALALVRAGHGITAVAAGLGVSRQVIYTWLRRRGVERPVRAARSRAAAKQPTDR